MTFDVLSTAAETARARRFGSCGVVRFTEGSDSASTPCAQPISWPVYLPLI